MSLSFDNTEIAFRYKNDKQLKQANFLFNSMSSSTLTRIGIAFTSAALKMNLPITGLIKRTIFEQFCGGETLQEVANTAEMLAKYNVGVALDYGVEGKSGEAEFDKAVPEFIKAIQYAASQKNIPFIPIKVTGFARFSLLEKVHAQVPLNADEEKEYARVQDRIDAICSVANDHNLMILVDAEESWIQRPVDELTDAMMERYNKGKVVVFNTFQLYCHDRLAFLKVSHERAKAKGYILGAKLVRGAYMEKERSRAIEMGYQSPIQPDKASTDKDYNAAVSYCLNHHEEIATFIGTHNEDSCLIAADIMKQKQLPNDTPKVYFAQLFGMSDNMTFNLANEGYHASKYLPYGPVKDVIPYLMRRVQENTSVKGQTGRELSLIKKEIQRRKL
ncbi:proline dehydrogenase family protein [Edaphocola flava]|uniref:proline dehydrogenase family protein n=1 Tax=Edaphocola flava TaxID=2499629 RepID=UPI00100ADFA1|nr:proline dehydrogenase family protein [Edaphocola flava]